MLVTVYNRQGFVGDTLASILHSVYQSFEVVVVDDCSKDNSLAIVNHFAAQDSRVRVFVNERNLGDYGNRMKAASLARGRFLKYVDSDDLIYPHTLTVMMDAMQANPEAALALAHREPEMESPYPVLLPPAAAWRQHFLGRGSLACGPTGAIMSREAFFEAGGFRAEWGVLSDIDLWLRMAARWPVALLPPGLIWWRKHAGQEFRGGGAAWQYLTDGYRLAKESLLDASCPLSSTERFMALRRAKQHHARRLLSLAVRSRSPSLALTAYLRSQLTIIELLKGVMPYQ